MNPIPAFAKGTTAPTVRIFDCTFMTSPPLWRSRPTWGWCRARPDGAAAPGSAGRALRRGAGRLLLGGRRRRSGRADLARRLAAAAGGGGGDVRRGVGGGDGRRVRTTRRPVRRVGGQPADR